VELKGANRPFSKIRPLSSNRRDDFAKFVPSPCTPLWASSRHVTITKNCAPMSHVVMGDSCSKSYRGCSQIVAIPCKQPNSESFRIASGRCINALQISSRRLGLHESPPSLSPQCGTICVRGASRPCFSAAENTTSICMLCPPGRRRGAPGRVVDAPNLSAEAHQRCQFVYIRCPPLLKNGIEIGSHSSTSARFLCPFLAMLVLSPWTPPLATS
jgi:hypothetical protein